MGDRYLAINQMLLELFYFMSYAIDGFAYASESLVGKYLGSGNIEQTKKVINKCLYYGLLLALIFSVVYIFFGTEILSLLTTNKSLIQEGQKYLIWCAMVGLAGALAFIWDGVYSGATASVELRNSMLLSVIIFFIIFYSVQIYFPFIAIWAAMIAFMLGRSGFQILLYKKSILNRWNNQNN
jgi:MATE family multidrug resistance protein